MKSMEHSTIAALGQWRFVGPAAMIAAVAELAIANSIRPQSFEKPIHHPAALMAISETPRAANDTDRL